MAYIVIEHAYAKRKSALILIKGCLKLCSMSAFYRNLMFRLENHVAILLNRENLSVFVIFKGKEEMFFRGFIIDLIDVQMLHLIFFVGDQKMGIYCPAGTFTVGSLLCKKQVGHRTRPICFFGEICEIIRLFVTT